MSFLTACGEHVEIAPAHVGKILTKNGYAPDTLTPSKFRLEPCMAYCDRLVTLEAIQNLPSSVDMGMPKAYAAYQRLLSSYQDMIQVRQKIINELRASI